MATVVKTFNFATAAESWVGYPAGTTVLSYISDVGNPAGSLRVRLAGKNQNPGQSYWLWTGTWEALGVPAGATVTDLQLSAGFYRCTEWATGTSHTEGPWELRNDAGTLQATLAAGVAVTATHATWQSISGSAQAVPSALQPSNTTIQLRVNASPRTGNSTAAVIATHEDQLEYTITYTEVPKEGGSSASITVAPDGSGQKTGAGSSTGAVLVAPDGGGVSLRQGGSDVQIIVTVEGNGEKVGGIIEGGSESQILIPTQGDGIKQARSPPADSSIFIPVEGFGVKYVNGDSEVSVDIIVEGSGNKLATGSNDVTVIVAIEGDGVICRQGGSEISIVALPQGEGTKYNTGSGDAETIIIPEGNGDTARQGGSETVMIVATQGDGEPVVGGISGGSTASIIIIIQGDGEKQGVNSASINIVISPEGSNVTCRSGDNETLIITATEGSGGVPVVPRVPKKVFKSAPLVTNPIRLAQRNRNSRGLWWKDKIKF